MILYCEFEQIFVIEFPPRSIKEESCVLRWDNRKIP